MFASRIAMCLGVSQVSLEMYEKLTVSFSRDGGIPGFKLWSRVSKRLEMPLNAFFLNTAVQAALTCIYFGSSAAFNAFIGVSVLSLGSACAIPIGLSFFRGRKEIADAPFYKGKLGAFCNV